jgi:membrane associated rhomboid family serine protease
MNEIRPKGFEVLPPVIIINVIVFFATIVLGKYFDFNIHFALHSWQSTDQSGNHLFKAWQLITHLFMHGGNMVGANADYEGGFMHLFSNMFGLWMFGSVLEQHFGSKRFLQFYLLCGIGAAIGHLLILNYEHTILVQAVNDYMVQPTWEKFDSFLTKNVNRNYPYRGLKELTDIYNLWQNDPSNLEYASSTVRILNNYYVKDVLSESSVGASGAIYGILGAFAYLFPNTYLYLYFMFPIKVKYAIALYAAYELYTGMKHSAGDNIAHFAHLGGLVVGLAIVIFWNKTNRKNFY